MSHAGTTTPTMLTRRTRTPLLWGVISLVAFALFGWLVALNPTQPFVQGLDDAWRRLVGAGPGAENQPLAMFFQEFGALPGFVVLTLVIPILLIIVRRWRSALFVFSGVVGSTVVAQIAKNLVNRPRPAADLENGLFAPLVMVDHGSFPSGHAVTMGFAIVAIAALIPAARRWIWWVIGMLLAVGMVWQRTFINAHWFSDTVAGLVAGAGATLILWWAFALLLDRDRRLPLRRTT